jgi:hypothetical protein
MEAANRLSLDFNGGSMFVANTARILEECPSKTAAKPLQNLDKTPAKRR